MTEPTPLQTQVTARILFKLDQATKAASQAEEELPSLKAIESAKKMIRGSQFSYDLPMPEVAADADELDITWHANGKIVQLNTAS